MTAPLKLAEVRREFHWNGLVLPDPAPDADPEHVKEILAVSYPELANGQLSGPEIRDGRMIYTLKTSVGTKG